MTLYEWAGLVVFVLVVAGVAVWLIRRHNTVAASTPDPITLLHGRIDNMVKTMSSTVVEAVRREVNRALSVPAGVAETAAFAEPPTPPSPMADRVYADASDVTAHWGALFYGKAGAPALYIDDRQNPRQTGTAPGLLFTKGANGYVLTDPNKAAIALSAASPAAQAAPQQGSKP